MPMMIVLMIVTEKASFHHLHRCNVRSAILIDHNSVRIRFIHYRLSINNKVLSRTSKNTKNNYMHLCECSRIRTRIKMFDVNTDMK